VAAPHDLIAAVQKWIAVRRHDTPGAAPALDVTIIGPVPKSAHRTNGPMHAHRLRFALHAGHESSKGTPAGIDLMM
jgi:hypothetical protein